MYAPAKSFQLPVNSLSIKHMQRWWPTFLKVMKSCIFSRCLHYFMTKNQSKINCHLKKSLNIKCIIIFCVFNHNSLKLRLTKTTLISLVFFLSLFFQFNECIRNKPKYNVMILKGLVIHTRAYSIIF